mmetsp:Transcript_105783/g.296181  ORF Transcript_105783/g.296181 Transcript_105783/m.296181 type:complete len:351 (+) Transcript_105783:78-1130(+)
MLRLPGRALFGGAPGLPQLLQLLDPGDRDLALPAGALAHDLLLRLHLRAGAQGARVLVEEHGVLAHLHGVVARGVQLPQYAERAQALRPHGEVVVVLLEPAALPLQAQLTILILEERADPPLLLRRVPPLVLLDHRLRRGGHGLVVLEVVGAGRGVRLGALGPLLGGLRGDAQGVAALGPPHEQLPPGPPLQAPAPSRGRGRDRGRRRGGGLGPRQPGARAPPAVVEAALGRRQRGRGRGRRLGDVEQLGDREPAVAAAAVLEGDARGAHRSVPGSALRRRQERRRPKQRRLAVRAAAEACAADAADGRRQRPLCAAALRGGAVLQPGVAEAAAAGGAGAEGAACAEGQR